MGQDVDKDVHGYGARWLARNERENIGHDVEWTLEPIDGSYDLVLVRDKGGMAMGTLHVESFSTATGQGELYEQLNDGHTVRVKVVLAE